MNITCFVIGHGYKILQEVDVYSLKLRCKRCEKLFVYGCGQGYSPWNEGCEKRFKHSSPFYDLEKSFLREEEIDE